MLSLVEGGGRLYRTGKKVIKGCQPLHIHFTIGMGFSLVTKHCYKKWYSLGNLIIWHIWKSEAFEVTRTLHTCDSPGGLNTTTQIRIWTPLHPMLASTSPWRKWTFKDILGKLSEIFGNFSKNIWSLFLSEHFCKISSILIQKCERYGHFLFFH